jgi:hypothetical protein
MSISHVLNRVRTKDHVLYFTSQPLGNKGDKIPLQQGSLSNDPNAFVVYWDSITRNYGFIRNGSEEAESIDAEDAPSIVKLYLNKIDEPIVTICRMDKKRKCEVIVEAAPLDEIMTGNNMVLVGVIVALLLFTFLAFKALR